MESTQLTERLEDLSDHRPGNVRSQADACLDAAWDHLKDHEDVGGNTLLSIAAEDIARAIAILEHLRCRVESLAAHEARQAVQPTVAP